MTKYLYGDIQGRNVSARGNLECPCGEHITYIGWTGKVHGLELVCDCCNDALFPHNTIFNGTVEALDDEEIESFGELE